MLFVAADVPHVMHYGLIYRVGDWQYDKHWYFDFDVHKCPPWDLKDKPKAGIFPPPPYPDKLPKKVRAEFGHCWGPRPGMYSLSYMLNVY